MIGFEVTYVLLSLFLHNEELRDLCFKLSIIRVIKSKRMRWAGHVARMRRKGMRIGYW
jgi:hypothetical protein